MISYIWLFLSNANVFICLTQEKIVIHYSLMLMDKNYIIFTVITIRTQGHDESGLRAGKERGMYPHFKIGGHEFSTYWMVFLVGLILMFVFNYFRGKKQKKKQEQSLP